MKFKVTAATCVGTYPFYESTCYTVKIKHKWWPWYVLYDKLGFDTYEEAKAHMKELISELS